MTSNEWNARSLDTQRFTELAGGIRLQTPLTDLPRVLEVSSDTAAASTVPLCDWSLDGQIRGEGARLQHWMHLQAALSLPQTCQRCLEAMPVAVQVDRRFRFVADEATALAEDDDCEEDLLAMSGEFNAFELLEDELLLAMPLIISHADCQPPASTALIDDLPHPFAALAGLKTPKP